MDAEDTQEEFPFGCMKRGRAAHGNYQGRGLNIRKGGIYKKKMKKITRKLK